MPIKNLERLGILSFSVIVLITISGSRTSTPSLVMVTAPWYFWDRKEALLDEGDLTL
jgi:hypothetical protein